MRNLAGFLIMQYKKPPLTYEKQIELLQSRGLIIRDKAEAILLLNQTNYYRLSAYCIPFQQPKDQFKRGTTLQEVHDLYLFDIKLRRIIFDALQTIEISLRAHVSYYLAHKYGAFGYVSPSNFSSYFVYHDQWMEDLQSVIARSREEFVEHYKTKYFGTLHLPIWVAIELISFGALSRLIRGLKQQDLKVLCSPFDVPAAIFPSWVHSLSYVRNICAHHGRLWNRELAVRPRIPKKTNRWHTPFEIPNNRIMGVSSVIYHMKRGVRFILAPRQSKSFSKTSRMPEFILDTTVLSNFAAAGIVELLTNVYGQKAYHGRKSLTN